VTKPHYPGTSAVIVGGGFAGVACAKDLAQRGVQVTLIDRNNYHQFQPLLYQLATAQLTESDIARPLRGIVSSLPSVNVKKAEVTAVDLETLTVTTADGQAYHGDYLVLAMGSQPNFFGVPGAAEHSFPLYTLDDAVALRSRLIEVFEDADRRPELIARGALNFVIIGAGATGVESAGALADLVNHVGPAAYRDLPVGVVTITLVDLGHAVLGPFSDKAHEYAHKVLQEDGVQIRLGLGAKEITEDRVIFNDGSEILTRTAVWAGGIKAPDLATASGLPAGPGGRLEIEPDLSVNGHPNLFVLGDTASVKGGDGTALPQLGSVAQQSGQWAARNVLADLDNGHRTPFHYKDKGIMAMIGRGAAVAEVGKQRHELHGTLAFAAWLGVHAMLLSGVRQRTNAFVAWGWDYFSRSRTSALLGANADHQIDWGDDNPSDPTSAGDPGGGARAVSP
jgi:NADH dehydrogenase